MVIIAEPGREQEAARPDLVPLNHLQWRIAAELTGGLAAW